MGRNFVDPTPLDDCPAIVETGESLAGASLTSKFQTTMMFPGVSSTVLDIYVEYVPRPVPRGPRSVGQRGRAESSSGLSAAKKSRQSSTHLGTPVVASMLLGEHINTLCPFVVCFCLWPSTFVLFQLVLWWPWSRVRKKRMMMPPLLLVGELFSCFPVVEPLFLF